MMKNLTLIILSALSIQFASEAQDYVPFPLENTHWTVQEYVYSNDIMVPDDCITRFYSYVGDTIIDGNVYSMLYGNNIPADFPYEETAFNFATSTYMGAVREDESKKVWLRTPGSEEDLLYYDFGLEVGDEFCFDYFDMGCYEVGYIDTEMTELGPRRLIGFQDLDEAWVEGVGSMNGWFEWQFVGSFGVTVPCLSVDDENVLGNGNCYCDTYEPNGVELIDDIGELIISPNPVRNELFVQFQESSSEEIEIEIFDILGSRKKTVLKNSDMMNIDLSDFSQGIYFIHFRKENQFRKAVKIIKKN